MGNKKNKREFTRVPVELPIEIQAGDRLLRGLVTGNLSMKGLLLRTQDVLAQDTLCTLRIILGEGAAEVRAEAQVVRIYPGAIAFQFSRILGTESFEHLRQLVIYNAPDADQVESELHEHTGIKAKE
jgi:hypothetical protein